MCSKGIAQVSSFGSLGLSLTLSIREYVVGHILLLLSIVGRDSSPLIRCIVIALRIYETMVKVSRSVSVSLNAGHTLWDELRGKSTTITQLQDPHLLRALALCLLITTITQERGYAVLLRIKASVCLAFKCYLHSTGGVSVMCSAACRVRLIEFQLHAILTRSTMACQTSRDPADKTLVLSLCLS